MKKLLFIITLIFPLTGFAGIYTQNNNFKPYIGINAGANIANYTIETDMDETYYSATINAGAFSPTILFPILNCLFIILRFLSVCLSVHNIP